jgi:translocation and assembly module TamB
MSELPANASADRSEAEGLDDAARPNPECADAPAPRRRWRLPLLVSLPLQLLLAAILILSWVLGTQAGLRTAIALAGELFPGIVSVAAVEGRVLGELHLRGVKVGTAEGGTGFALSLGALDFDWSPWSLISGQLSIDTLAVRDLDLLLPPDTGENQPLLLPTIRLPLRIVLGEALVERLRIFKTGATEPGFVLEYAALSATARGSELHLTHVEARLQHPRLSVTASGHAGLLGSYPLDLDLAWTLAMPPNAQLTGKGQVSGDLQRLAVQQRLTGAVEAELDAHLQDVLDRLNWDGLIRVLRVDLPAFQSDLPAVAATGRWETRGNLDDATLSGTLDATASDLPDFGHLAVMLDLGWKDSVLAVRQLQMTEQVSAAALSVQGQLDLKPNSGGLAITCDWTRLRWPLSGDPVAQSPQGRIEISGRLDDFSYSASTEVLGPAFPGFRLTLAGTGDQGRTDVKTLRLDMLDGRIDGQARVALAPRLNWDASLVMSGIDPGRHAPDWPGRLAGRLTTQGTLEADGPTLTVVIEDVNGRLRGYPIAAAGKLALTGQALRIDGVTAESGPSRARVDGVIDQRLDLAFTLDSPDLASLLPEAKGQLRANGKLQGPLDAPRITLDLTASHAELAGQGIDSLSGTAAVDLSSTGRFALQLDGGNLVAGGQRWSALAVRGEGSMPDHQLTVSLTGEPLSLNLATTGGLAADGAYQGRVATLDLKTVKQGTWRLQRPVPFSLAQSRIAAGPLCLRQSQGSGGCLSFDQSAAGNWTASLDLDRLDFSLLADLLPENLSAEGGARISGRFQATDAVLVGTATAEIPHGRVRLAQGQGQDEVLDFSNTRLTLDADARGLSARLGLPLKDVGTLAGDLTLPGWRLATPARPGQPLNGHVQANVPGLARLASLLPQITNLNGALDADLTLGGTLAAPGVKGQAQARNINFEVPLIALKVVDLNLSVKAPTLERMDLQGQANIGGGRLDLSGESHVDSGGLTARLKATGKRIKLADTKEYFAIVSPTFELEATSSGAALRGGIRLSEARIRPRALPAGTVSPSRDVVLSDQKPQPPYPLSLDLQLTLGDEVTIDAFGVRGRLAGNLNVRQAPGKDMLGDGQLRITEGEYRLSSGLGMASAELGAPLTITQGRLIFAKSPIGNPGLLLQAEREGSATTAGVRVLGTLRDPKLAFFSESDPGMTQAEITKYLMTGIPPSGADSTSQTGLAVGTYLAPKIYMEYESGLGDEENKVRLRYDLSRHIELQTETGEHQGADIYFKFEH